MEAARTLEAQLRELRAQIEHLDYQLTQQEIRLRSILKHYPDEDAHLPGVGRAAMEQSKADARKHIRQFMQELAELRVQAIGLTAKLPVPVSTMRQLKLTSGPLASSNNTQ